MRVLIIVIGVILIVFGIWNATANLTALERHYSPSKYDFKIISKNYSEMIFDSGLGMPMFMMSGLLAFMGLIVVMAEVRP